MVWEREGVDRFAGVVAGAVVGETADPPPRIRACCGDGDGVRAGEVVVDGIVDGIVEGVVVVFVVGDLKGVRKEAV